MIVTCQHFPAHAHILRKADRQTDGGGGEGDRQRKKGRQKWTEGLVDGQTEWSARDKDRE